MKILIIIIFSLLIFISDSGLAEVPVDVEESFATSNTKLPTYGIDMEGLSRKGSMMFSNGDLKRLYSAIRGNLTEKNDIGASIESGGPQVAPSFYLNSVVFISDKNWTIWINGKKIRMQDINPNIKIESIAKDRAEITWETKDLDIISPVWRSRLEFVEANKENKLERNGYISKKEKIYIPEDGSFVRFTLMPNQTFVSYEMRIAEGFVPETPIVFDSVAANKQNNSNIITTPASTSNQVGTVSSSTIPNQKAPPANTIQTIPPVKSKIN